MIIINLHNEIKILRENVLSLTLKKKDDEENLTDTPVDVNEIDDDDQYTSLEVIKFQMIYLLNLFVLVRSNQF